MGYPTFIVLSYLDDKAEFQNPKLTAQVLLTVAEQNFAGFSTIRWSGRCAPALTPAPGAVQLNKVLTKALV